MYRDAETVMVSYVGAQALMKNGTDVPRVHQFIVEPDKCDFP